MGLSAAQAHPEQQGDVFISAEHNDEQTAPQTLMKPNRDQDEAAHTSEAARLLETMTALTKATGGTRREETGIATDENAARKQINGSQSTRRRASKKRTSTNTTAAAVPRSEALQWTPAESREIRADVLMEQYDEGERARDGDDAERRLAARKRLNTRSVPSTGTSTATRTRTSGSTVAKPRAATTAAPAAE
ncbi:unnamed protein product [Phytophthora fragariaefolia]|uniref:Unnamed protein product n=1 Tax=Phytophthora fragariaefolia TaxID=1490495 RepID=A0A9W6Y2Y9_9STRA|nr:unnamed protein product [Phytophthora fragariaefolia]